MKKITTLLTVAVIWIASSCQGPENLAPGATPTANDGTAPIAVVDGRLRFATQEVYDRTVKFLMAHQNDLPTWEKQFRGYTSMRTAFESITTEQYEQMIEKNLFDNYRNILSLVPSGSEKEVTINIEDHLVSTVVSNKGLVQIGTDVFKITRDKVIKFSKYTSGMEQQEFATSDPSRGVTVGVIKRRNLSPTILAGARVAGEINLLNEYWVGSSKRRLIGTIYDWDAGGVYSTHIGLQTKHQRRFLGSWFAESIGNIGLNGSGSYQTYYNGIPQGTPTAFDTGNYSSSWDNYINYTLQYGGNPTYQYVTVTCNFFGIGTDGQPKSLQW
jgi:hypothetical protein